MTDPNCADYKACEILNVGTSGSTAPAPAPTPAPIPEAPDNLAQVCAQNATIQSCREYCHAATCCWKMAVSTYTAADGGSVTESVLGSCSHRDECVAYRPCRDLPEAVSHTSQSDDSIPKAPSNLGEICDPAAGNIDAYELCSETCHAASCCWKAATTTYMREDQTVTELLQGACSYKEDCIPYEPCKSLPDAATSATTIAGLVSTQMPAASIQEPPDDLTALCQQPSEVETCRKVCNEAICCWKTAVTNYEGDKGEIITEAVQGSCSHEEKCDAYKPCTALPEASLSSSNEVTAAAEDLAATCDIPATADASMLEGCVESCHQATCCWKTATTSYKGPNGETITESVQGTCAHLPECSNYKPCSVLEKDVFSPHSPALDTTSAPAPAPATTAPAPASSPTTANGDYTEAMIYDACYNHVDQPNAVKTMCEIVCEAGACCYTFGDTCSDGFGCTKYEPCNKLASNTNIADSAPTAVEVACGNKDDLADCVALCSQVTCCYTTDLAKSCDVVNPGTVCTEYTPCEVLYGGGGR